MWSSRLPAPKAALRPMPDTPHRAAGGERSVAITVLESGFRPRYAGNNDQLTTILELAIPTRVAL